MNLQIHLVEGFVHVLYMNAGHLNEVFTMAHESTNLADSVFWTK